MADIYYLEIIGRDVAKNEFQIIKLDDLKNMRLCPGHVFFMPASGGKPVCLLSAGSVVESSWLEKYQKKGLKSFYYFPVINFEKIKALAQAIQGLKQSENEEEAFEWRAKFLRLFWSGVKEGKINWEDLAFIGMEIFWDLPEKYLVEFQNASILFHERSHAVSTLGAVLALGFGYSDYNFLKDFYHALYFMDWGLVEDIVPYHMIEALSLEVKIPQSASRLLLGRDPSGREKNKFVMHPIDGFKKCKEIESYFKNPAVLSVVEKHHQYDEIPLLEKTESNSGFFDYEYLAMVLDQIIPLRSSEKEKLPCLGEVLSDGVKRCQGSPFFSSFQWKTFWKKWENAILEDKEFKSRIQISFLENKMLIKEG